MKTDDNLKNMVNNINMLRVYDDEMSIAIRARMIEELSSQIKNIIIRR